MQGYTQKKLAPKPRAVRGWRTLRVGRYGRGRLLVAILPNGKTRAVELLTPKPPKKRSR